jgi:hypothetical protein
MINDCFSGFDTVPTSCDTAACLPALLLPALTQILVNISLAEARGDLARIADLKYGALPDVDARLKALRDQVRT